MEFVDKLAFAEKPPLGDDNGGGSEKLGGKAHLIYDINCPKKKNFFDWLFGISDTPNKIICVGEFFSFRRPRCAY